MPSNASTSWLKSDPWMYYINGTLYYSYLEYSNNLNIIPNSQVTFAKSVDNGLTWTTAKASQNNDLSDKETFVVSSNGTVYLTYDDVNLYTGSAFVKLSKSNDNGKSFSDVATINKNNTYDDIVAPYPALSSNNTLFVSWTRFNDSNNYFGDVYYDYSLNGGLNFTNNTPLNPNADYSWYGGGKVTFSVIKFDSKDRLYALWSEYTNYTSWKVYIRYSDDFGTHWSSKIPIDDTPFTNQSRPDMAIDSKDNLHIVWYQESNNQFRPYYRELLFSGLNNSTISKTAIIPVASAYTSSNFTRPGDYLTVRLDLNDIPHVVWTDGRLGNLNIFYSHLEKSTPGSKVSSTPSSSTLTSSTTTLTTISNHESSTNLPSSSKSTSGFMFIQLLIILPIYLKIRKKKD